MSNLAQFKKTGLNNRGAYSASATYYVDDIVTYGNATYVCTVNGTSNVAPTNTTYWTLFVLSTVGVSTVGSGTNPASFTLSVANNTVTLNRT